MATKTVKKTTVKKAEVKTESKEKRVMKQKENKNNRTMTGTLGIPETIHQINTTSDRESYMFKKKAGLLTCNIIYLLPMPRTVDL